MNAPHCFVANYNTRGRTLGSQMSASKGSAFQLKVVSCLNGITGMSAVISYPQNLSSLFLQMLLSDSPFQVICHVNAYRHKCTRWSWASWWDSFIESKKLTAFFCHFILGGKCYNVRNRNLPVIVRGHKILLLYCIVLYHGYSIGINPILT